jgi:hypothetical protein
MLIKAYIFYFFLYFLRFKNDDVIAGDLPMMKFVGIFFLHGCISADKLYLLISFNHIPGYRFRVILVPTTWYTV